jgi:diguanylate cyclase (GGDEF)-like protein
MDCARKELGWALHGRAEDVAAAVVGRLDELWAADAAERDPEVVAALERADRIATRAIGRWLATGEGATDHEQHTLAAPGALADRVTLEELVKAYLAWRDATLDVLAEEAARLRSDPAVVDEVRGVVERSCDVSLVRMVRQFDGERRRLETELAAEQAKLAHRALHDPLTGLANRTLLFDRMARALQAVRRHGEAAAILFFDLDGFKAVNDRLGHEAGDRLLVAIGARLGQAVRPTDSIARLGGDEFVILCERLPADEAVAIAERALEQLRRPVALGDAEVAVDASVGIAVAGATDDPEALLKRADAAMYAAKQAPGADWRLDAGAPLP